MDCYNYLHGKLKEKDIRNCTNGKGNSKIATKSKKEQTKATKFEIITLDKLNIRKVADWDADPVTTVKKGQHLQVIDTVDAKNGSTPMYRLESGLYITASTKYIKKV